jgi:hypothetical protein
MTVTKAGTITPELSMLIGLAMISARFVDLIGIGLGVIDEGQRLSSSTQDLPQDTIWFYRGDYA